MDLWQYYIAWCIMCASWFILSKEPYALGRVAMNVLVVHNVDPILVSLFFWAYQRILYPKVISDSEWKWTASAFYVQS